jgi:type III pantothenate kinase
MNYTIEHMCSIYFPDVPVIQVSADLRLGIKLRYDVLDRLGTDRICTAVAAARLYGGPCITVDFGTATTFGILSADNEFLGGLICPGFKIATEALAENTALLPKIELIKPDTVIGTNTDHAIRSGIIYGFVGQVEYLIRKIHQEIGCKARVVATGGMSELIHSESDYIDVLNPTLTLEGLSMIYEMNA